MEKVKYALVTALCSIIYFIFLDLLDMQNGDWDMENGDFNARSDK